MNVLITGGAGFIGTHLAKRLLHEGCEVAVLDNFSSQVHAGVTQLPSEIAPHVELHKADVRDSEAVAKALRGRDVLVHLAAETGTGQSMYEVKRYQEVNIGGTATVLELLMSRPECRVPRVVVASSRAIYGEGRYRCANHGTVYPGERKPEDMQAGQFEPKCPVCGNECTPEATHEDSPANPLSFYGLTKHVQEQMTIMFARAQGFSAYGLRYQNVYGPGQSLKNPYTGILAIFSNLARANSDIQIFEDGKESRDFVFVDDVVDATWRCIKSDAQTSDVFNVGTGCQTSVMEVAQEIVQFFKSDTKISVTGAFRAGDIRHNFADLGKIQKATGFVPKTGFRDGLKRFLSWASGQEQASGGYESSLSELRARGLLRG